MTATPFIAGTETFLAQRLLPVGHSVEVKKLLDGAWLALSSAFQKHAMLPEPEGVPQVRCNGQLDAVVFTSTLTSTIDDPLGSRPGFRLQSQAYLYARSTLIRGDAADVDTNVRLDARLGINIEYVQDDPRAPLTPLVREGPWTATLVLRQHHLVNPTIPEIVSWFEDLVAGLELGKVEDSAPDALDRLVDRVQDALAP